jgi:hypothetical protein
MCEKKKYGIYIICNSTWISNLPCTQPHSFTTVPPIWTLITTPIPSFCFHPHLMPSPLPGPHAMPLPLPRPYHAWASFIFPAPLLFELHPNSFFCWNLVVAKRLCNWYSCVWSHHWCGVVDGHGGHSWYSKCYRSLIPSCIYLLQKRVSSMMRC